MAVLDSGADPIGNQRMLNYKVMNNQKRYRSFSFIFKAGPDYMIDAIAKALGNTTYDANDNDYYVDCDDKTLGNMEFTFGKFKVVMKPGDYLEPHGVSNLQSYVVLFSIVTIITYLFSASMLSEHANPE